MLCVCLLAFLLCSGAQLLLLHQNKHTELQLNRTILEMIHIDVVSARREATAHPYMRRIYQRLDTQDMQDFGSDGVLVQSFRSVHGRRHVSPGWIWFNVSSMNPAMSSAELVLFRKTVHPGPVSVTVALHSVTSSLGSVDQDLVLDERVLILDQRPSSGYDVFDVSRVVSARPQDLLGFHLRYTDDRGSLVLHDALTQQMYCLDRRCVNEPLLVLYDGPLAAALSHTHTE